MVKANERPTIDLPAGIAAFEEDLAKVLKNRCVSSLEELGWSRPSRSTLLVPFIGTFQGKTDSFYLRLGFQAYRKSPPSAQFVNPETLTFDRSTDQRWVPQLTSEECRTHLAYNHPSAGTTQLICCSATFEFYDVLHHVKPEHMWRETETFLSTIIAIQRAMESHYQGPFPSDG